MNKSKQIGMRKLFGKIESLLEKMPGQSVKELAEKLGVNRNLLAGYLQALEELGYVTSRKVGPARVYYIIDSGGIASREEKTALIGSKIKGRSSPNTFKSRRQTRLSDMYKKLGYL